MTKKRVFADTNVVIEAFRTGCWTAICARYAVETVEKCVEDPRATDRSIMECGMHWSKAR